MDFETAVANFSGKDFFRAQAIVKHLDLDIAALAEIKIEDYRTEINGDEYLILTGDEADEFVRERIRNDLWAFKPEYIVNYMNGDFVKDAIIEGLNIVCEKMCESANEFIYELIKLKFDDFVDDAVCSDGRGHFLSGYDFKEHEIQINDTQYYIYKQ